MRVHTNNFKEEINKMGRQIAGRIYYYNNFNLIDENDNLILTEGNSQIITEFSNLEDYNIINSEDIYSMSIIKNGDILQSLMKEVDFETKIELPVGIIIKVQFGVLVNNEYEYLDYGNYIIKSRSFDMVTETWSYICYDKMLLSMIKYVPLNIIYPIKIKDYLLAICNYLGITFEYETIDDITWVPYNFEQYIYSELFENKNLTFRDILDKIAEVSGGNILINDNDNMTIVRLTPFPDEATYKETIDEKFLKDVNNNFDKKFGPVNQISITDTSTNIEYLSVPYTIPGVNEIFKVEIKNNEFAFNGHTTDIANNLVLEMHGLEYYFVDLTTAGVCYLDFLDRFKISYKNKEYPCLLLNNEITITQGIEETIFADETEKTKSDSEKFLVPITNNQELSFNLDKQKNEINSKVSKGEIISSINQSAEEVQIQANKISLEGKEINLTSDNVVIDSTNFNVDKDGNMSCNNATANNLNINGGKIQLTANSYSDQRFVLTYSTSTKNYKNAISPSGVIVYDDTDNNNYIYYEGRGLSIHKNGNIPLQCSSTGIDLANSSNQTTIQLKSDTGNIYCNQVIPSSIVEKKKNFEKLTNAKDILKQVDIYKYNFKDENDDDKKHIGFVIGDNFNYSKEITSNENSGVELYSMVSVLWQVVKEQQEEINELKEMIKNGKY